MMRNKESHYNEKGNFGVRRFPHRKIPKFCESQKPEENVALMNCKKQGEHHLSIKRPIKIE